MPRYQHILFDLDGTLIDSAPAILASYREAFSRCDVTPARVIDESIVGPPLIETLQLLTASHEPALIERLADACRMGKHQRALQILQVFRGDTGLGQQAKAGINAIRRTAFSDNIIDAGDAGVNSIDRPGIQTQFDRLLPDFT